VGPWVAQDGGTSVLPISLWFPLFISRTRPSLLFTDLQLAGPSLAMAGHDPTTAGPDQAIVGLDLATVGLDSSTTDEPRARCGSVGATAAGSIGLT